MLKVFIMLTTNHEIFVNQTTFRDEDDIETGDAVIPPRSPPIIATYTDIFLNYFGGPYNYSDNYETFLNNIMGEQDIRIRINDDPETIRENSKKFGDHVCQNKIIYTIIKDPFSKTYVVKHLIKPEYPVITFGMLLYANALAFQKIYYNIGCTSMYMSRDNAHANGVEHTKRDSKCHYYFQQIDDLHYDGTSIIHVYDKFITCVFECY